MISANNYHIVTIALVVAVICSHMHGGESRVSDFPELNGCACPGDQLTFECTAVGGVATIWHGSAFDCGYERGLKLSDEIVLRRSQFNSQVESECGSNERIVAQTVGVVNNTYFTSLLNVTVSSDMNNRTIQCDRENADGSRVTIDMTAVTVATKGAIQMVENIFFTNVSRGLLMFKWSVSSYSNMMCPTDFIISSSNCGACPTSATNTNATCLVVPQTAQLCTFAVIPRLCSSIYDNARAQNITVLAKVPDPPEVRRVPNYVDGQLSSINTTLILNENQTFNFSSDIDGSPIYYTIVYSDSTAGTTCARVLIPASSCVRGVCTHIFAISSSTCLPGADISVSVFSTNLLGDGPMSEPITIASGLNSNGNGDIILYLVSAVTALAVLLITGVCGATVLALVCLAKRKRKPSDNSNKDQRSEQEDVAAAYEEIDEFRRISCIIDTSKNMAYMHISGK